MRKPSETSISWDSQQDTWPRLFGGVSVHERLENEEMRHPCTMYNPGLHPASEKTFCFELGNSEYGVCININLLGCDDGAVVMQENVCS